VKNYRICSCAAYILVQVVLFKESIMNIGTLLKAAEYIERRDRGKTGIFNIILRIAEFILTVWGRIYLTGCNT